MQNADSFREVRHILEDAERPRSRHWFVLLGSACLGLLITGAIAYAYILLTEENSRLTTEIANFGTTETRAALLADRQQFVQRTALLQAELKRLQLDITRQSDAATRPITPQQIFVLEELTSNAAWRNGQTEDATQALLLGEFGVGELSELTGEQWQAAIARLYEIRKSAVRRAYDPVNGGQ